MSLQHRIRRIAVLALALSAASCNTDRLFGSQAREYQLRVIGTTVGAFDVPGIYQTMPLTDSYIAAGTFRIDRHCNWTITYTGNAVADGHLGTPSSRTIGGRCSVLANARGLLELDLDGGRNVEISGHGVATIVGDTVYQGNSIFVR